LIGDGDALAGPLSLPTPPTCDPCLRHTQGMRGGCSPPPSLLGGPGSPLQIRAEDKVRVWGISKTRGQGPLGTLDSKHNQGLGTLGEASRGYSPPNSRPCPRSYPYNLPLPSLQELQPGHQHLGPYLGPQVPAWPPAPIPKVPFWASPSSVPSPLGLAAPSSLQC